MDELTSRQTQLLKAIVDEYIETADPVGSSSLEKKYSFGISPATIRSEMMQLTNLGFLRQPHTSAGRIPTAKAMKFYINQLMEEREMSLSDEVRTKEQLGHNLKDVDLLMQNATKALATSTHSLAVATLIDDPKVWHSGYANIFSEPELSAIPVCESLFNLLEEQARIHELFFEIAQQSSPIDVLFGEELGWPNLYPLGIVATHFKIYGKEAALGAIGPVRLSYSSVIPIMRYLGNVMQEITKVEDNL